LAGRRHGPPAIRCPAASAAAVHHGDTTAGSTAIFGASALQRCLRDIHTVTQHVVVAPPTYEIGKIMLGVESTGSCSDILLDTSPAAYRDDSTLRAIGPHR
jgi:hypothetical protein